MGAAASIVRIGLVVAAALATFAAPTEAQLTSSPPLSLQVQSHEGRILPITDHAPIAWTVTFSCDVIFRATPEPVIIRVRSETTEPWIRAEVVPGELAVSHSLQSCPLGETRTGSGDVVVQFTRDAPAYHNTSIPLRATMEIEGDEYEAENSTTVVPDFYSILSATAERSVVNVGPGDNAILPFAVENLGNGDMVVRLAVEGPTEEFDLSYPNETEIDSPYGEGKQTSAVINVGLSAPGAGFYTNDHATFDIRFTAFSAREPEVEGDHATVSVMVVVRGVLGSDDQVIPAVGFAWLVLPFAALLRRR